MCVTGLLIAVIVLNNSAHRCKSSWVQQMRIMYSTYTETVSRILKPCIVGLKNMKSLASLKDKINLCIVGAGEVVRDRYSRGLNTSHNKSVFCVRWLYDVLPEIEALPTLKYFPDAVYRQIPLSITEASHQIIKEVPSNAVIIIATPVHLHIPYALNFLDKFHLVAIEKPATNSKEEYHALEQMCYQCGCSWFPLAYYLIEKALPYLILMQKEFRIKPYLDLIEPQFEPERLSELRKDLGSPRKFIGCILEGIGSAGTLNNRKWVLTPEGGGNTWETLFHLSSLVAVTPEEALEPCAIAQSRRGIVRSIISELNIPPHELEDTANLVNFNVGQLSAIIFSAKYLSTASHQRWLRLECDGGEVVVDFSNASMVVETKNDKIHTQLIDPTPYHTQFALLSAKVINPDMPLPWDVYREAFKINKQIYDCAQQKVPQDYEQGLDVQTLVHQIGEGELTFPDQLAQSIPRKKLSS